jgi:uncharacterized protein YodC (DUF2158 family)
MQIRSLVLDSGFRPSAGPGMTSIYSVGGPAEVHWYEAAGIGRKEFKIKHLL